MPFEPSHSRCRTEVASEEQVVVGMQAALKLLHVAAVDVVHLVQLAGFLVSQLIELFSFVWGEMVGWSAKRWVAI